MEPYTQYPSKYCTLPWKVQEYIRDRYLDIIYRYFPGNAVAQFVAETDVNNRGIVIRDEVSDLYIFGVNNDCGPHMVLSVLHKYNAQQELESLREYINKQKAQSKQLRALRR